MFTISIPKPCFEGWENMAPNEQGRYCNACAKTVVDFSVMSDEAVKDYFIINYGEKICGRFKKTQLQRIVIDLPQNIFRLQLPFWKKFLVAFLIIYGSSFFSIDTTIAGTPFNTSGVLYEKLQGTPVLKKDTQKKKRKRKKYQLAVLPSLGMATICETPVNVEILGYTVTERVTPFPTFDTPGFIFTSQSAIANNLSTQKEDSNAATNKEKPKSKSPDLPTTFILPAALALRNPFSKKKKA